MIQGVKAGAQIGPHRTLLRPCVIIDLMRRQPRATEQTRDQKNAIRPL
jgi:hypothetical protein